MLDATICNVQAKLDASKSTWAVTTGPVASFTALTDDRGQTFDLRMDPHSRQPSELARRSDALAVS